MDGTKRKFSPLSPSFSPITLGDTPPWSLPTSLFQESAIRSTQICANAANLFSPEKVSICGDVLAQPGLCTGESEDDDSDYEAHVDTKSDGVYMINAGEGSWSRSLPSEDDPAEQARLPYQAEKVLAHLKRAKELANQQESIAAGNAAMEALFQEMAWKKDLLLRNTIRRIKKQLPDGGVLVLERLESDLQLLCAHPHCPASNKAIPTGAYYLHLTNGQVIAAAYCLFCLESLWNGDGMLGPLDAASIVQFDVAPQYYPPKPSPLSQTHFQIPESLLSSKHAPPAEEIAALLMQEGSTPGSSVSSQDSIDSDGEWRRPPTRFQRLHGFVSSGTSLNKIETSAVDLWKMASEDQLRWKKCRQVYKKTVGDVSTGSDGDEDDATENLSHVDDVQQIRNGGDMRKDSVQDLTSEGQEQVEGIVGLTKRQCQGRNLTAVLAEVRSKQAM